MSKRKRNTELVERKKWDKEYYQQKAAEFVQKEKEELIAAAEDDPRLLMSATGETSGPLVMRAPLQKRTFEVELDERIGTSLVITSNTPMQNRGGWYCEVCECQLKDSHTYLDHINGRRHNKKLGMSMRVERSTLAGVKERIRLNKLKQKEVEVVDVVHRMARAEEQRIRRKEAERARKRRRKEEAEKALQEMGAEAVTEDMAAAGFNFSFGGSKKNG